MIQFHPGNRVKPDAAPAPPLNLEHRVAELEMTVTALVADRRWLVRLIASLAVDLERSR